MVSSYKVSKGRKVLLILLVVLILAIIGVVVYFLFFKNPSGDPTTEKIEIVYWGLWEPNSVMEDVIAAYEAKHQNVKIIYVQKSFSQYEASLPYRLSEEAGPDIVRIHNTWLPVLQKHLTPLPSKIMSTSEYSQNFYNTAVKSFTGSDNAIYAIPLEVDGLVLYYNKDLLAQAGFTSPPTDWDEFLEMSIKLTKRSGTTITQAGAAIGTANNINHADEIIALLLLQNSANIIAQDGKASLSNQKVKESLSFYTGFVKTHNVWNDALSNDLVMFHSGKLAMMFAPSWRVFDIINANPEINFDIAPVPQLPANQVPIDLGSYWGEAVSAQCDHPEIAWDFIKYLSEAEQLRSMYSNASKIRAFGEPYGRPSMASEISTAPYVDTIIEIAPYLTQMPIDKTSFQEVFYPIIDGMISSGSINTGILNNQEKTLNEILESYKK
ncbi:sugar ABC transporter substrate-binding protein [Candidatus Dojkabacteria bacterium]|nr:sugar ABC transporter substrate-binding protein [Candidatus Dojkabacteria bacterium]